MDMITLASTSPQRRELLQRLRIPFRVLSADIEEDLSRETTTEELVQTLAKEKVEAVQRAYRLSGNWIIGADTVVLVDGVRLGKPPTVEEAERYLRLLSGRDHLVVSGIALADGMDHPIATIFESTTVRIARLEDEDIAWYLSSEEWQGAAGAYKIQGRGACFVERIEGSYTNVVGLPIHRLYGMLRQHQYKLSD